MSLLLPITIFAGTLFFTSCGWHFVPQEPSVDVSIAVPSVYVETEAICCNVWINGGWIWNQPHWHHHHHGFYRHHGFYSHEHHESRRNTWRPSRRYFPHRHR